MVVVTSEMMVVSSDYKWLLALQQRLVVVIFDGPMMVNDRLKMV